MKRIYNKVNILLLLPALALVASCHKDASINISQPQISAGQAITSDTLAGSVKGTLLSGKTYYFSSDITVNAGDTLLMQAGSKLIALGDGLTTETSPQITVNGTFVSLGTQDAQNFITVPDDKRINANVGKGFWGGIQCGEASGDLVIKWTHLEFAGGPAGPDADPAAYSAGDPRYTILFANDHANCILEDSWIFGSTDDGMRVLKGRISIMRNTFEACGKAGGESVNLKSGTVGDVAYNLSIGAATNSFKSSNSGGDSIQTNVYTYNNTMVNGGLRQVKSGRGGSINYEKGAQGKVYNNIVVNCRFGLRITTDADIAHIAYNNQFYYGNADYFVPQFNAADGIAKTQSGDVGGDAAKANNPMFATYDVDMFDYSSVKPPLDIAAMPFSIITAVNYNFSLLPGSPALKTGFTDFQPLSVVPAGGLYGATIQGPGVDMGAYQSDGSGNQHYASSLSFK